MFRKGFMIRLVGVLILVGLLFGVGAAAYRAGLAQGVMQAPAVAQALTAAAENGQIGPMAPLFGRGYGYPMGYGHHFGFSPFGAFFGALFFLFLFFGALRMIFFHSWRMGWRHHGPQGYGPHGHPWHGARWMNPEEEPEAKPETKKSEPSAGQQ